MFVQKFYKIIASVVVTSDKFCRCIRYRRLIIAVVADTSDKLIAGVIESMKIREKAQSPVSITLAIIYRL
jgi:hypothetical protein